MMVDALSDNVRRLSPSQVADTLPSRPILTTGDGRWDRAVLQCYDYPPSLIGLAPFRDHIVVLNLNGSPPINEPVSEARTMRRRTDTDHFSPTSAGASVTRRLNGRRDVLLLHLTLDLVQEVESIAYGQIVNLAQLPSQLAVADDQMHRLAHLLLFEAEHEEAPGQTLVSNYLIKSLIIQILRGYDGNYFPSALENSVPADSRIERALTFMRRNFADKITADQLAVVSGASMSSFSRLFREAVGQSAYQYLIALRLEHALGLLEQTALSITAIAFESGFGQPTHFTTVFRERFGVSPRAWRSAHSALKPSPPRILRKDQAGINQIFLG